MKINMYTHTHFVVHCYIVITSSVISAFCDIPHMFQVTAIYIDLQCEAML